MKFQSLDTKIDRKNRNNFKPGEGGGVVRYITDDIVSFDSFVLNGYKCESVWCKITRRPPFSGAGKVPHH